MTPNEPMVSHRWLSLGVMLLLAACSVGMSHAPVTSSAGARADTDACRPPPLKQRLFLRGTMTTWTLREDLAFRYVCDAYLLNVDLQGAHTFRITDERFSGGVSFGAPPESASLHAGTAVALHAADARDAQNLAFAFEGRHTLRLAFVDGKPLLTIGPRTFHDPADTPVVDPRALSLRFDSRAPADKSPFGALRDGSTVDFALHAATGVDAVTLVIERRRLEGPQEVLDYSPLARVPLTRTAHGGRDAWRGSFSFDAIGVYGYYFIADIGGRRYAYGNNADPVYWTRELGSNGLGAVTPLADDVPVRRFRQTIYRGDFRVPDWAPDIVYYYIFPERFRNGDARNDPRPGPRTFHDASVEVHADWLQTPFRPGSGDGSDELHGNDFYGGDLDGITQRLDSIVRLGANTLYLTPIFSAASNHKYDTADYRHVDAHFGGDAAFARLVRAAEKRNVRIVLDTSLNHTGSDSIYFDRYANHAGIGAFDGGTIHPESPYASWYHFDPAAPDADHRYRGWAGARDLPELDKSAPGWRAFAYGAPDSIMKRWLDRGASGWRMDVAPWIPDDFWREWRSAVKGHRADALAVCETQFEASKFLLGDEFDATMNYVFRNAVEAYANGSDARVVYRNLELLRETYPRQALFAMMNLLSTHDSPRALYDFGWRDAHDDAATVARAKQRLRLAAFFQMTYPGAPTVFYGDEVGVTGGEDPFNRVTYPWPDRGGRPDLQLRETFRRLIALRNAHAVLRHGSLDAPLYIDEHVIVLLRQDGANQAVTALNNDALAHAVTVTLPQPLHDATFADGLSKARVRAHGATLTFTVQARDGRALFATARDR